MKTKPKNKKIALPALTIMIVCAIDNIRHLPAAALCGTQLIFFYVFSALVFLIPTALVAAELSATFSDRGGIYHWINKAFGSKAAIAAGWLQWINTLFWYPAILFFISSTFAYLIDPKLAQNKTYLIFSTLGIFWAITLVNLKGVGISTRISNTLGIMGTLLPLLVLIGLSAVWIAHGNMIQISLDAKSFIPSFQDSESWISLIAIMASFLGMELSGAYVNDVETPQKTFPRAMLLASLVIVVSMVTGSMAIALVLPTEEINLIAGNMQVFGLFLERFGLLSLMPLLALCMAIGTMGMMVHWVLSPAKSLLYAAEDGFLPSFLRYKNKAGAPAPILIAQALAVTLFSLIFYYEGSSVGGFYWFFTAISTELYMIMYLLMFCAALRLHYSHRERPLIFKIPGKSLGIWMVSILGITSCVLTICISFIPPDHTTASTVQNYLSMIIIGNAIALSPLLFFWWHQKHQRSRLLAHSTLGEIHG